MPSLHCHRIACNLTITMLLLTTLCPKRCRGLQNIFSSTTRRTSRHYGGRRFVSSQRRLSTALPLLSNDHYYRSKYPHRATLTKLYSTNSDDVATLRSIEKAASSFLKQHLAQLEYDGKLTSNEATSVASCLQVLLEGETTLDNIAMSNFTNVVQTSIESYLTQKESRRRLNSRPIENVGGYVRTIVRNQLANSRSSHRIDAINNDKKQQQQQQQPKSSNNTCENIHPLLQPFIQRNQINQNELNESCLRTLSQTSNDVAQYALEAYVRQKQRRLEKDMAQISDPSLYVLKILR